MKRTLQEIIKNQEEIKAKLGNFDAMLQNIIMYVGNNSEQLIKSQGWPDIFSLPDVEAFLKFESFLEKKDNFSFTVFSHFYYFFLFPSIVSVIEHIYI